MAPGYVMTKRTGRAKKTAAPKKARAWLERNAVELKAEAEKLAAGRQWEFPRELEKGKDHRGRIQRFVNC